MNPILRLLYQLPFTQSQIDTAATVAAVSAACAVPGVFLVLRRVVMVGDAISHVLLLGIVLAYFAIGDLRSPWLLAGAAATGVATVVLVELVQRTRVVKEDAAIGLVFPALFSLGVILATLYTRNVHLDADSVLLGQAEFASYNRLQVGGVDHGPWSAVVLTGCFFVNVALLLLFYKEVKLATFDAGLAVSLGFAPAVIHYGLMTCVSITTVAAFDAVGPVLVLAFFAVPPATAYLLTDRLSRMILLSVLIGVGCGLAGTAAAFALDTNMAGTVAAVLGLAFAVTFVAAPRRGLVAQAVRRWRQRREFFETMLAIHLRTHEGTPQEADESRLDGLHRHLNRPPADVARVVERAERKGLVTRAGEFLKLTPEGRRRAAEALNV
jgi:manganese/zinc/iron transport system permease protein